MENKQVAKECTTKKFGKLLSKKELNVPSYVTKNYDKYSYNISF